MSGPAAGPSRRHPVTARPAGRGAPAFPALRGRMHHWRSGPGAAGPSVCLYFERVPRERERGEDYYTLYRYTIN